MVINNLNLTSSDYEEKLQRCQEYVDALEEERRKIQVFQRELPLCLELVTQAIEACKQQLTSGATEYQFNGQSECSEQTSSEGPVLEEFIPIKRGSTSSYDEDELSKRTKTNSTETNSNVNDCVKDGKNNDNKAVKKSDWLSCVQLWNQSPDPTPKEDTPKKVQVVEVKRDGSGGAFHPFRREKSVGTSSTSAKEKSGGGGDSSKAAATGCKVAAASSSVGTGGSSGAGGRGDCKKEEKEGDQRKQRRCWSPELHRRFLQALQQLGGSHVATPKQIRELMKVDGLTNDEVKSHLQKYRLHTRRPSPSMHNNNTQQAAQFVVVGGIWVPPPEYTAMAAHPSPTGDTPGSATANGIYAPIASHPSSLSSKQRQQQKDSSSDDHGGQSEGGGASHSPATSSSDTTTASPSAY